MHLPTVLILSALMGYGSSLLTYICIAKAKKIDKNFYYDYRSMKKLASLIGPVIGLIVCLVMAKILGVTTAWIVLLVAIFASPILFFLVSNAGLLALAILALKK